MGGFFGAVSKRNVVLDVFFGTDYHSHLGTRNAGMAIWSREHGCQRQIHSIANTPFRTKFEKDLVEFHGGCCGIGCISDSDPQPLLVRSHLGLYAITTVGQINNSEELVNTYFSDHGHQFMAMSSGSVNCTELVAALINERDSLVEGIRHMQSVIEGSMTVLLMTSKGEILAARDRLGRLPVLIGQNEDGFCVSFESFAYEKLGYHRVRDLGPAEIVRLTADGCETLSPAEKEMKICAFLWSYYGYPNSNYEGINVEAVREIVNRGVAVQINCRSFLDGAPANKGGEEDSKSGSESHEHKKGLFGLFGKSEKQQNRTEFFLERKGDWARTLLSEGLVHFIASDCHDDEHRSPIYRTALEAMEGCCSVQTLTDISKTNILKLIRNERIV